MDIVTSTLDRFLHCKTLLLIICNVRFMEVKFLCTIFSRFMFFMCDHCPKMLGYCLTVNI